MLRLAVVLGCSCGFAYGESCGRLREMKLAETTIVLAQEVPAGAFVPPYGRGIAEVPAFCRVVGVLHPTADSRIKFEVWMPAAAAWNGRFLGVGNGGFAGAIGYESMATNLKRGFATAATDTGHEGEAEDASWAYRHPEKVVDYGYRGIHLTAERGKAVVAAFYGKGASKAYFDSCSDGGREALMEAQRYPEDYDGILAGAPANFWSHMVASGLDVQKTLMKDPAGAISAMKLPAITKAVLAACDARDGVKDGVLNDPRACRFDPGTLLCKGEDTLSCLTGPQVVSLKKLYTGGRDSGGKEIFPGYMPGDESPGWDGWVIHGGPGGASGTQYMTGYFRYMVMEDPAWDPMTADVDAMVRAADSKTAKALNATETDLSGFAGRGGKLILYHGWDDPAISPLATVNYYEGVRATMGAAKADGFVRLYMVPGMEHCAGGPGANNFGQLGQTPLKGALPDAFTALEGWVEEGRAAGSLLAVKYAAPGKVKMTRPLCAYPLVATYDGVGDVSAAGSFACKAP